MLYLLPRPQAQRYTQPDRGFFPRIPRRVPFVTHSRSVGCEDETSRTAFDSRGEGRMGERKYGNAAGEEYEPMVQVLFNHP